MNPNQRWVASSPNMPTEQTYQSTQPYRPQYPGESPYLPQPDYDAHPALRGTTLRSPNLTQRRVVAGVVLLAVLAIIGGASYIAFGRISTTTKHPAVSPVIKQQHTQTTPVSHVQSPAPVDPDTMRHHNLVTIQSALDAYYSKNNHYPSLTEMNSSDWLSTNMPGLAQSVLADPAGSSPSMASKPMVNQYAYQVYTSGTKASCEASANLCTAYVLTATLNDNTTYVLKSANS